MIFIDTNIAIQILNASETLEVLEKEFSRNQFAIATPSVFELYHGVYKLKYLKKDLSPKKYRKIKDGLENLLNELHIYELNLESSKLGAKLYVKLKSRGEEIDTFDCLIAAVMIVNGYNELITNNIDHFKRFNRFKLFSY